MSWDSLLPLGVTTGAALLAGGYLALKVALEQQQLDGNKERELAEVVHLVSVDDVAPLLNSVDDKVRRAAEQFIILRSTRTQHLVHILKELHSDDVKQVVKAATGLYLIAKSSEENKGKLLHVRAITIISQALGKISDDFKYAVLMEKVKKNVDYENILARCVCCLFQLTLNDEEATIIFCSESSCIRSIFLNILGDQGFHISCDVKRWVTFLIHQLAQLDMNPIKKSLRKWGVIRKASFSLIKTLGDILQTQLCLQILIQYLSDSVEEIVEVCQEMATLGLLPHLVGLLRCDEEESVVQLSAVIIHHFCCFDMETTRLSAIPGIVKILYTVLNNTDASVQKTILRICNYLVVGSSKFRKSIMNYKPMLRRLSICMASGNSDVVYGSLMLIHDLALPGKQAVLKLIQANHEIIKALVTLSLSSSGETVQLVAETLGFVCSCEGLHSLILRHGVVNAILHFAKSGDVAVQFWASALILNLSMISDEVKETIIRSGGIHTLLEMAVSGDEVELPDIATNATKTLVILGFLDAEIKIKLVSGLEGSIIIDGTEHCPGKQGINLLTLDFINYKFSKGQVLQPNEFKKYLLNFFKKKNQQTLFAVTQGACTMFETDEELPTILHEQFKKDEVELLRSPAWCLILTPNYIKQMHGYDNLEYYLTIPIKDLVSNILKENFTDPLVDVLMSMPPSSNVSKVEELELIEILARHSFQRRTIVSTAGFLEYFNELIWSVASLKSSELVDPDNAVRVSHCVAALKILHACSIDKTSISELIHRGMLRALQSLVLSIVPCLINKDICNERNDNIKILDRDQKPGWFDLIETTAKEDMGMEKDFTDEFDDAIIGEINFKDFDGSPQHKERLDTEVSNSNDDLFQVSSDYENTFSCPVSNDSRTRTVTYNENVEYFDEEEETVFGDHSPQQSQRIRTDSFIVRSDSRNIHLEHYRTQSVERPLSVEPREERPVSVTMSPGRLRGNRQVSVDHQQMRRISRSLSISIQQSKTADDIIPELVNISDVLKQLVKHTVMIIYHIIQNSDEVTLNIVLNSHLLPLLLSILGCLSDSFRKRIGLAVSAVLIHSCNQLKSRIEDYDELDKFADSGVTLKHGAYPKSCIMSPDTLEISNENWFFESVYGSQSVGVRLYTENECPKGWFYEVVVLTDGILQIGWANEECEFSPEKGIGVGDNIQSCGYDGARCKLWNGPSRDIVKKNDYGIEWQPGDAISVLLSCDGILTFWLNGKDLGQALDNVDMKHVWSPAVSLSIDQHCLFCFNRNNLRHEPPDGFVTVSEVFEYVKEKNEIITPPVRTSNQAITEDSTCYKTGDWDPIIQLIHYFELDVSFIMDRMNIDIGYFKIESSKCEQSESSSVKHRKELNEQDLSISSNLIYQTVSNIIKRGEIKRKVNVIGCGIDIPSYNMILTKDGVVVAQLPLEELVHEQITENFLIDLLPYVSHDKSKINFGQLDFVFEDANTVTMKHMNAEKVSSIVDAADRC